MHKVGQLQSVQPEGQTSEELFCTLLFLEEYAFLRQACHWLQVFSGADAVVLYATPAPTTERSPPEAVAEWPEQYEFTQISESAQEFTRTDSTAPTSFTPQRQRSPRTTPVLVTHRVFVPNQEKRKRPAAYFLMQKWHDCTLQGEQVWPASQEDRLQAVVKKTALELEKLQQRSLQQLQETLYSDSLPAPVLTPQRYRQATQNLSISVWEWDLLANTVRNDGYLKKILGRQAVTSLDPFHWSEFVHPDDLPPVLQACQEVRQGVRRLMSVQYRMQHADGSWRWIRSQGQFLHDDPTTRLIIGTDCDITNEVQANESVSQLREELLHIARLSMGGEMAAGLAHEITQPMTAIRSYAAATRQLVATEAAVSLPAEILQYLTKIEFNAADASATLEGIRALFYPVNMQLVSITLGTLIDQAVSMMGTELQQRGITLVRENKEIRGG